MPERAQKNIDNSKSALQQQLIKLLDSFQVSERMPFVEMQKIQFSQLSTLAQFAEKHSAWFSKRLKEANLSGADISNMDNLRKLPLMTRKELQENAKDIFCRQVPQQHVPIAKTKTSGSSGMPVEIFRTALTQIYWLAYGLREHLWHKRNFMGKLAAIRANLKDNISVEMNNWGEPVSLLYKSGPACALPINRSVNEQLQWLNKHQPDYLLVYPNNLAALLDEIKSTKTNLYRLEQIRTLGETMPSHLRQRVKDELDVTVTDSYSSQELGSIAIQCPEYGNYHIMAESLIVEILDEQNNECKAGETGRVVVTDITNYATPIFRYDIGDYAEVGEKCKCGRHLPTLKSIKGRERNMVIINGKKSWPLVGFQRYRDIAPITQYQIVQKSSELIEARFVAKEVLTNEREEKLAKVICESLGHNFNVIFKYYQDKIPASASGKFEEFLCEVKI